MMTCNLCHEEMPDFSIARHLRMLHPNHYEHLSDDPVRFIPGPECDLTTLAPDEQVGAVVPYGWAVYRTAQDGREAIGAPPPVPVDKPNEN